MVAHTCKQLLNYPSSQAGWTDGKNRSAATQRAAELLPDGTKVLGKKRTESAKVKGIYLTIV
jgi:hypothetical protein